MKFGFNSKTQVGPDLYDVQTEDRGVSHPFIDTLVLIKGRVVYRHSTSYEDLAASGALGSGNSPGASGKAAPGHIGGTSRGSFIVG